MNANDMNEMNVVDVNDLVDVRWSDAPYRVPNVRKITMILS